MEHHNIGLKCSHGLGPDLGVNIGHGYLQAYLESLQRQGGYYQAQFVNTVQGVPYKRVIVRVPASAVDLEVSVGDYPGPTYAVWKDEYDQLFDRTKEAEILSATYADPLSRTILTRHNVEVIPFAVMPHGALSKPDLVFITRFEEEGYSLVTAGWDVPEYLARFGQARMHAKIPFDAVSAQLFLHEEKAKYLTEAGLEYVVPLGDVEV